MVPDNTFSSDGLIPSLYPQPSTYCSDVVVQGDGKIVGAITGESYFRVFRLNDDGSWDNNFGVNNNGLVEFHRNNSYHYNQQTNAVRVLHGGKIMVVGSDAHNSNRKIVLSRLNSNGEMDFSFGTNGIVVETLSTYSVSSNAYAAAIRPDLKATVAGVTKLGMRDYIAVMQYNTDGTRDNTLAH